MSRTVRPRRRRYIPFLITDHVQHACTQIEAIQAQEDTCVFPAFDSNVAWELGTTIRTHCRRTQNRPAVIYIAHANSFQLLFFAATGPGTSPNVMHLVKRKEAVVLRWGMSTLRMRLRLQEGHPTWPAQDSLRNRLEVADPSVYAFHGGGFPVRVKNVEGIVGVIVVSGLKNDDNHDVIVECIQHYLSTLN